MNIEIFGETGIDTVASVTGVYRSWRLGHTEVQALRGVNMQVGFGELLAICGPSGSGKTTLLNLLGLLDRPDKGCVRMGGRSALDLSEVERASIRSKSIGFVFQSFNLLPVLDALENVLMPLYIAGNLDKKKTEYARELLDEVGLSAQMHQRPDRMSGGQRQRVALARALVMRPGLVLADEPTANLDSESSDQVMNLIRKLNQSTNVAFVLSTHDERIVSRVHRRINLRDGRVEVETEHTQQERCHETSSISIA